MGLYFFIWLLLGFIFVFILFCFVAFILLDTEGNKVYAPTLFHYIYLETR